MPQLTNFATDFIKYKEGGKKALLFGENLAPAAADSRQPQQQQQAGFTNAKKKKPTAAK